MSGMQLYFGIVEDVDDPLESGRIKARVFGVHAALKADVPTDVLPWAQCMQGAFNSSFSGIGESPTGMEIGQTVVVVFLDPLKQFPLILGAMSGMNEEFVLKLFHADIPRDSSNYGFQQILVEGYEEAPDTNVQARSEEVHPYHENRLENVTEGILPEGETFTEPDSTMTDSKYPHSKVWETSGGHLIEIDNTEGNERILVIHKSGSFMEMSNEGMISKITGNNYDIVAGDDNIHVEGMVNISIEGDVNLRTGGKINVENPETYINTAGNTHIITGADTTVETTGNTTVETAGNTHVTTGADTTVETVGHTLIKSDGSTVVESPTIDLGVNGSEPMVMGNAMATWISSELMPFLNTHNHIGNMGSPTSPPVAPFAAGTAASGGPVYSKNNTTQK